MLLSLEMKSGKNIFPSNEELELPHYKTQVYAQDLSDSGRAYSPTSFPPPPKKNEEISLTTF